MFAALSFSRQLVRVLSCVAAMSWALQVAAAGDGIIEGRVVTPDLESAPFVDVFVEGENVPFFRSVLSDEEGRFRFTAVPSGRHSVRAATAGFIAAASLHVDPDGRRFVELRLGAVEAFEEVIDVDARLSSLVDVRETDVSSSLDGEFVHKLPLQNERIQDVVFLFPGVVRSGSTDSTDISMGGGDSTQIGYRVDGASINDPVDGGPAMDLSTAAIQEVKLNRGGFSAKHGEQSSGILEVVTRSGSNTPEFRYSMDWRDSRVGAASVDGLDTIQGRVHELISAEGSLFASTIRDGLDLLGIEPSTLADDNDPPPRFRSRHAISGSGPIVRDRAFFHATLQVQANDFGSAFDDGRVGTDQVLFTGAVNWNVSPSNRLKLTVSADVSDTTGFAGVFSTPSTRRDGTRGAFHLSIRDTQVFSERVFLESRLSALHAQSTLRPAHGRAGVGTQVIVPLPPGGSVTIATGDASSDSDETVDSLRLDESLSFVLEDHELEVGGSVQLARFRTFSELGRIVVDGRVPGGTGPIGAAAGAGSATLIDGGPAVRQEESMLTASFYIQDRWQVTPSLTLDVGLRADHQGFVDGLALAPRFGFSLDPVGDGKTRFFGNWGIFHDNVMGAALRWTARPQVTSSTVLFGRGFLRTGFGQTAITEVLDIAEATPLAELRDRRAIAALLPVTVSRFVLADGLSSPRTTAWTVGLERRLPGNMRLQTIYSENERTRQFETRGVIRRQATEVGEPTLQDLVLGTTGAGRFRQWVVELQRAFSDRAEVSCSYVRSRNTGPVQPESFDPRDVITLQGVLSNDRTHVVKLQGWMRLPWQLDLSVDFTWQTGQPVTPLIIERDGTVTRPLGVNSLRLPSSRQLNVGLTRSFTSRTGLVDVAASVRVFNVLGDLNVFDGMGTFDTPRFVTEPERFPPLRPAVLPTGIDVGRSLEMGVTVSF